MLNDSAVYSELVLGGRICGTRFRDQSFENGVDDVVVPCLGRGVVVGGCSGQGRVASIVTDLTETCGGNGLCGIVC